MIRRVLCVSLAATFGGMVSLAAASATTGSRYSTTSITLSPRDLYDSLTNAGGHLYLVGPQSLIEPGSALTPVQKSLPVCNSARVNLTTLALTNLRSASCADPALYGETVLPVNTVENGGPALSTVRIAHVAANPSGFVLGPVIMSYREASDTDAVWTYGDGCLWVFDSATTRGSQLLQVSEVTGKVVASVSMPDISRPLLASDDEGLWLAPASNSLGGAPRRGVYLYRPGARSATLVAPFANSSSQGSAGWLVSTASEVDIDVAGTALTNSLWRFDSPGPRRSQSSLPGSASSINNGELGYGGSPYAADANGVWTIAPVARGPDHLSGPQQIVRLDPSSGAVSIATTVTPPASYESQYAQPVAATGAGAFYFLDPPTAAGFSALYRVATR